MINNFAELKRLFDEEVENMQKHTDCEQEEATTLVFIRLLDGSCAKDAERAFMAAARLVGKAATLNSSLLLQSMQLPRIKPSTPPLKIKADLI